MKSYAQFLTDKIRPAETGGIEIPTSDMHRDMFPFQRDLTTWALRKGRAAIFADTGLGKTIMQLMWALHAADNTLILAPLAVAKQTVMEAGRWGLEKRIKYARSQDDALKRGITITNYAMMERFDAGKFGAVVLDESSILKSFEGKR